jgi:hypothetical protein
VNATDFPALIEQYRSALEAKLERLVALRAVAARQLATTEAADIDALSLVGDQRQALTSELVALEQQIRVVQERLKREQTAHRLPGFDRAVSLQQTVGEMVRDILETDRGSVRALEHIVADRRAATQAAEQAEATLAAYARILVVPPSKASLLNRSG